MSLFFKQNSLAGIQLRNRSVRSATYEAMATQEGLMTQELIDEMIKLAKGEVGLIISGHAYVSKEGQAGPLQMAVDRDECIPGMIQMAESVHNADGKIIVQLAHAGAQAFDAPNAIGPSPIKSAMGDTICNEMSIAEIKKTITAFADAAVRCKKAGFDGIQIHAAHGYLLSQFLSPFFNKRIDEYGGDIVGRSTIVIEVLQQIKEKCGADYPVMIKINSNDFIDGGFSQEDCLKVCSIMEENGIDAIEFSGGALGSRKGFEPIRRGDSKISDNPYYFDAAKEYKEKIKVPLILVGGIRFYENAEQLLEDKICDYISFCRPLIREVDLIKRWHSGDKSRATCISCNLCILYVMSGKSLLCVVEKRIQDKKKKN
jgi:2,4-dienoyl-CoA reductase-like NADH-dependent reductase (Old Yellow Enzyme family)